MEVLTYDLEGSLEDMIHRLGWQESWITVPLKSRAGLAPPFSY
jgi:hypothetical protein